MNCEPFVRWCFTGIARSSQAERTTGSARFTRGDVDLERIMDGRIGKIYVTSATVGSGGIGVASAVFGSAEITSASAISTGFVTSSQSVSGNMFQIDR